jgi:hypothetical protein
MQGTGPCRRVEIACVVSLQVRHLGVTRGAWPCRLASLWCESSAVAIDSLRSEWRPELVPICASMVGEAPMSGPVLYVICDVGPAGGDGVGDCGESVAVRVQSPVDCHNACAVAEGFCYVLIEVVCTASCVSWAVSIRWSDS